MQGKNNLIETRGNDGLREDRRDFFSSILNPQASFNGLWSFEQIPEISINDIKDLSYKELIKYIFDKLGISSNEISLESYKNFDDINLPLHYTKVDSNLFIQELYHGPTRAFKDMALQPFGSLLCDLAIKRNEKYLILTATSGDTGPATLESIKGKKNIYGICMYPHNGTSDVQRRQMTTIESSNIKVLGINGNFDDAQAVLKDLLSSRDFRDFVSKKGFLLSASNSVNIGRIAFQIIYHIHSYIYLLKSGAIKLGEKINIIVPSGNFGNALGAFYAKIMGIGIDKIIIATNANDVLCEFINSGVYDISKRVLLKTNSPAMDILKSSNVERVLFSLFKAKRTRELMESLDKYKKYELNKEELAMLRQYFSSYSFSDSDVLEAIKKYASKNIIIDPHTANGILAYDKMIDNKKSIVCSTAEWSKFATTITKALGENLSEIDSISYIATHFKLPIHNNISDLFIKKEVNNTLANKENIQEHIMAFINSIGD